MKLAISMVYKKKKIDIRYTFIIASKNINM